ncbi:PREDICTED: tetraspanin-8 [Calidris pugnax]|uniref:tetraspanin-8 n=1 Tax=Calidris pugnax TaxID=198806 RepID=UPI00071D9342|nr:PREDICTED: tetraspanin-8 [Calidris pugnax]
MAGVSRCMKYSMFIFNFFFWVCGVLILGISVWIRVSEAAQEEVDIDHSLFLGADLLIAVGAIIMVLGFLGCCGAIKESRCMLLLFFIGLLLILLLQVTGGILGAMYKPQVETSLNKTLLQTVHLLQNSTKEAEAFQEKFHEFEKRHKCCGVLIGPADWGQNFNKPVGNSKACACEIENPPADLCITNVDRSIYKMPCREVVMEYINGHLLIIIGIAFGLVIIEILGLGFSMSLFCQIKRK